MQRALMSTYPYLIFTIQVVAILIDFEYRCNMKWVYQVVLSSENVTHYMSSPQFLFFVVWVMDMRRVELRGNIVSAIDVEDIFEQSF